jgi:DUF4097 and DUF4098 domain-containing protein YvlB
MRRVIQCSVKNIFPAAALLLATLALGAPARAFDQTYQKTVALPSGGTLHLENVNGPVDIRAWDRESVEIYAVKKALRSASDLDLVGINVKSGAGRVEINTQYPVDQGVDVTVEYKVMVPRHVTLENITTINGTIQISGVEGTGLLHTVNGDIEVYDCSGGLSARTTNGNIHEEVRTFDAKDLSLETMNGSILVALPANAGAQLDAQSLNGEIRTEKPVMLNGAFGHGSFRGKLGAGGAPIRIRTVNGAIQLVVWKPSV